MVLALWTYTREEWNAFLKKAQSEPSKIFNYCRLIYSFISNSIPEIRITPERVWIGKIHRNFNNGTYKLKNIELKDEVNIYILQITYKKNEENKVRELRIPIPKGKLREAIELQEKLLTHR